jgi:hypothetical protein
MKSLLLALAVVALPIDSNIGTWKLNVEKSTFMPGPTPRSQTLHYKSWGTNGVTATADGVGADGKPTHWEFRAKYDGKDNRFAGNPDADAVAFTRIDAHTIVAITKIKGKVTGITRAVISADGNTRTLTQTGTNARGQDMNNLIVYDKQ